MSAVSDDIRLKPSFWRKNLSFVGWFSKSGYFQGVFWIILVSVISNINDILMRLLGQRIDAKEVVFFRFFFAALTLLPIMFFKGKTAFKTARPVLHVIRAILGFFAVASWCYGVGLAPLAVVSTMALTVPLFVLPMAYWFLKEHVGWQRTLATLIGFLGIVVIAMPENGITDLFKNTTSLGVFILLLASILFALSDILNKIMVKHESTLSMLFYFALGTTIAGFGPMLSVWILPTFQEIILLFLLGSGGNLILYCLLKAFRASDVSALAPFRYMELIFATGFGYLLFSEIPGLNAIIGAFIIVPSTFCIAIYETKRKAK